MSSSSTAKSNVNVAMPTADASQVDDAKEIAQRGDTKSVMRLGFWVLIVGFCSFLAWASFAPLDEGVVAPATVAIETRRKAVQHMTGGVVKAVQVKEGAVVEKDQVLVVLDDGSTRAAYEVLQQTYLSQRATEGRLLAEARRAPAITFHRDLSLSKDPLAVQHMQVQQQLFASRRASQVAEIAAANQSVAGLEGQVAGLQQVLESRKTQAQLQAQQLVEVQKLAADGYAPRNQALQLEQQQAEMRASMADIQTTMQRVRSSVAETRLRIAQREQEFVKEVSAQLAEVQREVDGSYERLQSMAAELARTVIRAPVAGEVLGLTINGTGAVVTPGMRLMDIVPQGEALLLDAHIPTAVIDRIKAGDQVEVRFSAFANAPQLVVHGRVVSLSADALAEQTAAGVNSYFLGRVALTPEGQKALGNRVLHPGMVAEVLVKTGERSLLTYLLHPLTKRIAAAMTEE